MRRTYLMKSAAVFAMLGMFGSAANAGPTSFRAVDPLVAVSLFGSSDSQTAVCAGGAQAAAAAGAAVATQAGSGQGCVLPAVDAAAPPAAAEVLPPAAPAVSGGIGVLPVLAGLAAIVAVAVLLTRGGDDGEINLPVSP